MRRTWIARSVAVLLVVCGCIDRHEEPGEPSGASIPREIRSARTEREDAAGSEIGAATDKRILFGDLHVHTTFSADAFIASLPMLQGEGAHPPADACDFARFCSALDFWSINDHAETVSPRHWRETKEAIRQCNAVAGDPADPDVVAFLGWEWTQVGATAADHYGHKNVIFRETTEDRVPTRPISALSPRLVGALREPPPLWQRLSIVLADWSRRERYLAFADFQEDLREVPLCPAGVDVRELPDDCHESAETPGELFEKLDQWGFETLVIPHGTTWGLYTPPGSTFDKQLFATEHDPGKQSLFEIFSGHGNSEEWRPWTPIRHDEDGTPVCPEPTEDYEPCCWRAGEIIRSRCADATAQECEHRVDDARRRFLEAGVTGRMTVPGTEVADWKDCGHCRDCFLPAYNYQPGSSAQYALALSRFDEDGEPERFRFGFVASSDNHAARPGTGYKEFGRIGMTEARGTRDEDWRRRALGPEEDESPVSVPFGPDDLGGRPAFQVLDFERQASFFLTGGLVAVHAEGRDRDAIWSALGRRETYGTSGDRILLWFDLLNGVQGERPMGSEAVVEGAPRFRVRAIGALEQLPGCPEHAVRGLGDARLAKLCRGECYNPGDRRRRITRIEVVRIRPSVRPDEPLEGRIEDPWRRFECRDDPAGCVVEFDDPELPDLDREALYYVRAIQEPTPAVNGDLLRCHRNEAEACAEVDPCYGDSRTSFADDCLAPNEERAWSSPIWIQPAT